MQELKVHLRLKYFLEISLISLVIQTVRPNYFSKDLLKFVFYEIRFQKIYMNNLKDLNRYSKIKM